MQLTNYYWEHWFLWRGDGNWWGDVVEDRKHGDDDDDVVIVMNLGFVNVESIWDMPLNFTELECNDAAVILFFCKRWLGKQGR
jgi:hypothetical protein